MATRILATSFRTDRSRPDSAIASIRLLSDSSPRRILEKEGYGEYLKLFADKQK